MHELILSLINQYGYIGILLLIAIENVFPPIPSEVILTFSGFMAKEAELNILLIIIFSTLGSIIGAIILYFVGYLLNTQIFNKIIDTKLGKILHLKKDNINKSIEIFKTKGYKSVFFARLAPIIRSLISIPAGMCKMNFSLFLILTTLGSFIWNTILILLGNMVGENYLFVSEIISKYYKLLILIAIVIYIAIKWAKRNKIITIKH